MRFYAPPGAPLQAAVDRLHGHGLFLPTLTGEVSAATTPWAATAVTDGTAHTKGAWVEVVAATTVPVSIVTLVLSAANNANGVDTSTLLDIGIGGAGSETVIAPDLGVGYSSIYQAWQVPVRIPVGSRVAVRAQSTRTTQNISIWMLPWQATTTRLPAPTSLVNIGADTATSHGVNLTVPGATHTKGAWTEITASCPQAIQSLALFPQGAADTILAAGTTLIDVSVGAAGAEVVVVPNWITFSTTGEDVRAPVSMNLFPVNIPKGARIAARYQTSNTGNSLDLTLLGVPA